MAHSFARRAVWAAALAAVAVAAIVVWLATTHRSNARGAASAQGAATLFVTAINDGQGNAAAAIACSGFADGARSAARSGADPGISYTLGPVSVDGNSARAILTQAFDFSGSVQQSQHVLSLRRSGGRWLVCGQS